MTGQVGSVLLPSSTLLRPSARTRSTRRLRAEMSSGRSFARLLVKDNLAPSVSAYQLEDVVSESRDLRRPEPGDPL